MADKDLRKKPHNITHDIWWYEEPKGICLFIQFSDVLSKTGFRTEQYYISWETIRAALKRKDK